MVMKAIHPWGTRVKSSPDKMKKETPLQNFKESLEKMVSSILQMLPCF